MPASVAAIVALLVAMPAAAEPWLVDPAGSQVRFRTEAFYGTVDGTLGAVSGTLDIDPATRRLDDLRISVATADLTTGNALEDRVMRSAALLDTGAFPQVIFRAGPQTAPMDTGAQVAGDLVVRDTSGTITVTVTGLTPEPPGVRVRVSGAFSRNAFGMSAFAGLVEDQVDLDIDLLVHPAKAD